MHPDSRLTKSHQFEAVREHGQSRSNRLVVLRIAPNALEHSRYGFTTGRRLGKAVVRNRVKRRMREATRRLPVVPGWDLVFIARGGAASATYRQLGEAIHDLLERSCLLLSPLAAREGRK